METIPKSECRKIGFIRKTHGLKGEIVLEFDEGMDETVENSNRFFIELDGLLVPFFIHENGIRFKTARTAILSLNWVENEEYARRFTGKPVWLLESEIIDSAIEFDVFQLKGFVLYNQENGRIGEITQIDDYSGNIVLCVDYLGNEALVPFNNDLIIDFDMAGKTISLKIPEGLLEE
jgi:16S rRNA processing protein RimM